MPNVKLRMLSSSRSHAMLLHDAADVEGTDFGNLGVGIGEGGSTSTTFKTALPSSTFWTLSVSQLLVPLDGELKDEEPRPPAKASQKALPSLLRIVCEAIAANIACCCSFSRCCCASMSFGLLIVRDLNWGKGDVGVECDEAVCLPESRAEREPGVGEGDVGRLGFDDDAPVK